ncbi:MAG: Wzz/FepE/Etk N-terminal domain-containing protein, partial [Mangrovibacterium sp.]
MNQEYKEQSQPETDEIDLIELTRYLWDRRKFIIKLTAIFIVLGIFIALFSEREYTASSTLLPQTSDRNTSGNVGALAALAGISVGGSSAEMSPSMYPKIINSIPFLLDLVNEKYHCP